MQTLHNYTKTKLDSVSLDDCVVKKIPKRAAEPLVAEYHYTGGMGNAPIPVGLTHQPSNELLGVVVFHAPISEHVRASIFGEGNEDKVIELHRMAIRPIAPHNTGSWLISRALDVLEVHKPHYKAVVSFADTTEGHDGTVYQAANADYYGMSGKAIYYEDSEGVLRAPRQNGENISKSDAKKSGWSIVERDAKHRYVFWLPDEYESKEELREQAEIELQEYPE
jgi:hypothetical protein